MTVATPSPPPATTTETDLRWAAYSASGWALLFAVASFYWAAGGSIGTDTVGDEVKRLPGIVALLWAVGIVKLIGALLALALVRSWGRLVPRRLLLSAAWAAGGGMVLYGAANLTVRGLMAMGAISTPESMHSTAATWRLVLWDPWWLLGGILFAAAAWSYGRSSTIGSARRGGAGSSRDESTTAVA